LRVINRTATVFPELSPTSWGAGVEPAASAFYCNALTEVMLCYDTSIKIERVTDRKENEAD
jgi:hypothetical protein